MSVQKKTRGIEAYNTEQNRQTKESLREALTILMEQRDYGSISISELCRKAGVSRSGFYANFATKNDVFEEIVSTFIMEINEKIRPLEKHNGLPWYEDFFALAKKNAVVYRRIRSAGFQGKFLEISNKIILQHDWIDTEELYRRLAFNGAIQNMTFRWIDEGMRQSVRQMAVWSYRFLEREYGLMPPDGQNAI